MFKGYFYKIEEVKGFPHDLINVTNSYDLLLLYSI